MMKQAILILSLLAAFSLSLTSGEKSVELKDGEAKLEANSQTEFVLPVLVLRAKGSSAKPDFWLGWMDWSGAQSFKPVAEPFTKPIAPFTQQITQTMLDNIPGLESFYGQINQLGEQMSGSFGGSSQSGGASSLSSLLPGLG